MIRVRNNITGIVEEVPESQIPELIARGSHSLPKDVKIPVIAPDGSPGTIDSSEAHLAFQSGFQYDTPELQEERRKQERFGDRPLSAAAAGVARGLTFGLSDQALTKSGLIEPETLKELKERNPETSIVGEAGGIILPTIASGGLGLAGTAVKGAAAVGRTVEGLTAKALAKTLTKQGQKSLARQVVSKTASKGAGSAVEGAFYGAGHIISEDALGNADFNAESLMSSVGVGALIGGAAGGLFGLGEIGSQQALKGAQIVQQRTRPFFNRLFGASDTDSSTVLASITGKKHNLAELRRAADELDVQLTVGAESNNPITRQAESILNETPSIWGEEVKKAHDKVTAGIQRKADEILEVAGERTAVEVGEQVKDQIIKDLKTKYDPFNKAYDEIRKHRPVIDLDPDGLNRAVGIVNRLKKIGSRGGDVQKYVEDKSLQLGQQRTVDDLANFISEVKADSRAYMRSGNDRLAFAAREVARLSERYHDRTILKTAINLAKSGAPESELAAKQLINAIRETNRNYAEFQQFLTQFGKAGKLGRRTGFRSTIEALEDLPPEQVAKKLFNLKDSKSIEFMRTHFPNQFEELRKLEIAKIAARVTKEDPIQGTMIDIPKLIREYKKLPEEMRPVLFGEGGSRTIKNIEMVHSAMPGVSNPSRTDIRRDFTRILTPVLHLRDMALAGLLKLAEKNSKEIVTVKGVQSLAKIEKSQKSLSKSIKTTVDRFLKGVEKVKKSSDRAPAVITNSLMETSWTDRKKPKDSSVEAAFNRHAKELGQIVAQPDVAVLKLNQNLAVLNEFAPKTALSLQMKAQKAVQFLYSKLPSNPAAGRTSNLAIREWKPSTVEMKKFERYVRAVESPLTVLEDLERGIVNREGVEVLREIYPEIYNRIVLEVTERIAELRIDLPYKKRLLIGNLLNVPIDLAQEPKYLSSLQQTFGSQEQVDSEQQGAIRPTAKGLSKINLAGQVQTETERIQTRS